VSGLLYRPDMDRVRERLERWWNGGDIGRPAMQVRAPRRRPLEKIVEVPRPDGWLTDYSTSDFSYPVYLSLKECADK